MKDVKWGSVRVCGARGPILKPIFNRFLDNLNPFVTFFEH